ncbi:MAG: FHA domain-containing protein [Planctomycetes bacterium]|nr:FHA domain-containing protein [Planctomycetota bacterium]
MLKAELKAIGGKHDGQIIPLATKKFLIGREQDCHLRPNSDAVSRHHCVIVMDEYTVRVRDLGSTNGTFVNGERIQGQVILKSGDRIEIGDLTFEVLIHEQAEVAQPAAAAEQGADAQPTVAPDLQVPEEKAGSRTLTEIPVPDTLSPATQDTTTLSGETTVIQTPQPTVPQGQQPSVESPTPPPATQVPPAAVAPSPTTTPTTPMPAPAAGQPAQPAVDPQLLQQQLQQLIQQQLAQQAGQPAGSAPPKVVVDLPPVRLPDPEETGVKEPPPEQKAEKSKEQKADEAEADPTHVAADIIRKYMRRRT